MSKKVSILLYILLFQFATAFANTHYVSKTGMSVYPYDTWETAADSIQKAVNAANDWDTVKVGAGTYQENVIFEGKKGISLIGAGTDSTTINASQLEQYAVRCGDSSLVEGFYILSRPDDGACVLCDDVSGCYSITVQNNKIRSSLYSSQGILLFGAKGIVRNNLITRCTLGFGCSFGSKVTIENNYFVDNWTSIWTQLSEAVITNNVFTKQSEVFPEYSNVIIKNNISYNTGLQGSFEYAYGLPSDPRYTAIVENNTVVGIGPNVQYSHGIFNFCDTTYACRNNIVVNFQSGINKGSSNSKVKIQYNDSWNNGTNYDNFTPDSTNISQDPMFVQPDSNFHLQYGSPCIDAGDPNVLDKDGTRSDMGAYGGILGQSYVYLDLPPKKPDSLTAVSESLAIVLRWKANTENDLSHYVVYKDTLSLFIPDTFKIVGIISKDSAVFKDYDFVLGKDYYYRVSAYDLTNHQSQYSDELKVKATKVWDFEDIKIAQSYSLYQNFPNPFNPITTIAYHLPNVGPQPAKVDLIIYDILGRKVRTLVSEKKAAGNYTVVWDGKDDSGNELPSGVYFYRMTIWDIEPPFHSVKKMVLMR